MNERQALEDLLKDVEAMSAKIKARLARPLSEEDAEESLSADTSAAIERVQSEKTSDDTGNW